MPSAAVSKTLENTVNCCVIRRCCFTISCKASDTALGQLLDQNAPGTDDLLMCVASGKNTLKGVQQLLQAHGFLEGERRPQLTATLRRLLDRHLRLFWQVSDVPVLAVATARSQRVAAVDINPLNRFWTLRLGQVGAEHRAAANEPDAYPNQRSDGAEPAMPPAA